MGFFKKIGKALKKGVKKVSGFVGKVAKNVVPGVVGSIPFVGGVAKPLVSAVLDGGGGSSKGNKTQQIQVVSPAGSLIPSMASSGGAGFTYSGGGVSVSTDGTTSDNGDKTTDTGDNDGLIMGLGLGAVAYGFTKFF